MPVHIRGAGAIIWRQRGRGLEVLIVHRPTWNDWSFPKGKIKGDETLQECCIREMKEETGYDVVLGVPLGWQHYKVHDGRSKEVRYWAATVADKGSPALAARPKVALASTKEVDDVRWVSVKDAHKMLSIKNDRELLDRLVRREKEGHLRTTPVLITRHTRAMKRSAFKGPEKTRPLTKTGRDRAERLVGVMAAYGVVNVVSSPWKRCMDTVGPYAKATKLDVDVRRALTETRHSKKPKRTAGVADRVITQREPAAVCVHRPTLPTVLAQLGTITPGKLKRQLPKKDPWLLTGEVLVTHVTTGGKPIVVAYEKIRPVL